MIVHQPETDGKVTVTFADKVPENLIVPLAYSDEERVTLEFVKATEATPPRFLSMSVKFGFKSSEPQMPA
jgi:hypothetical protein